MGAAIAPMMLVGGLAGAGLSAAGTYGQMQSSANSASYQAQVAANSAKIAQTNEELETQSGEISAANSEMKTRTQVGKTLAGQGASGVDVNSGSSVDVRAGESELGLLDAMTIRSNAARKAYGYQVEATSDLAQSNLLTTQADNTRDAAPWAAAASLLSGASSVGGKYASWQNAGTTG